MQTWTRPDGAGMRGTVPSWVLSILAEGVHTHGGPWPGDIPGGGENGFLFPADGLARRRQTQGPGRCSLGEQVGQGWGRPCPQCSHPWEACFLAALASRRCLVGVLLHTRPGGLQPGLRCYCKELCPGDVCPLRILLVSNSVQ